MLVILTSFTISFIVLGYFFLLPVLNGAPYVPSSKRFINKMIQLGEIKPGIKAVDIGSGDGRVVIALARAGAEAHGVEINPILVFVSRRKIYKAKLENKAFIHSCSYWDIDFSEYNLVTLFGVTHIMKKLEKKLRKELKPGAKVISNYFTFPTWMPVKSDIAIYMYEQR